jgi:hypothetical protein
MRIALIRLLWPHDAPASDTRAALRADAEVVEAERTAAGDDVPWSAAARAGASVIMLANAA